MPARKTPLSGSYAVAVAMALLALCPFLILTSAAALFDQQVVHDLGSSKFGTAIAASLANAGYAFGAVVSADLIQRVSGRRLYLACESAFIAGSLLALLAPGIILFCAGRTLQGVATGMLLVAALPPLVTKHGPEKLPSTAAFVNLGLFGVVALGPVAGGLLASAHAWRALFVAVTVLGVGGLTLGVLGFDHDDPPDRGMRFDGAAIPVAALATFLPFFGAAWASRGSLSAPLFLAPVVVGVGVLVFLVVAQYRKTDPLMPVRPITHTLPVTGIASAMIVGAAFTTLVGLIEAYLVGVTHTSPAEIGGLVAPQVLGVAIAAWVFKRLLPTRWTPVLVLAGVLCVVAAALLLLGLATGSAHVVVPVASFLLGLGAAAGVTPGLFLAGLCVPSARIGRTFALVELLRSEAAFLVAPILLVLAAGSGNAAAGVRHSIVITIVFAAAGGGALVALFLLGGARLQAPDLEGWLDGDSPAYDSPPIAAAVRDV